ncbi:MAG: hypothetical protein GVY36_11450 [Verrucomicrobia bacterium]|jgi:hypothetical protein|nr:hypothetical protein [Verrucomicrobiota bacterium]
MAELTNLTDRLTHLRERNSGSPIIQGDPEREKKPKVPPTAKSTPNRQRSLPADYFVIFAYTLFGVAVITQFLLIAWLDLI